jgi:hypothetical protein
MVRKLAASVATLAAATGLATFATVGSFDGTDPFPHSAEPSSGGRR